MKSIEQKDKDSIWQMFFSHVFIRMCDENDHKYRLTKILNFLPLVMNHKFLKNLKNIEEKSGTRTF